MSYEYKIEINYNLNDRKCEKGFELKKKKKTTERLENRALLFFFKQK